MSADSSKSTIDKNKPAPPKGGETKPAQSATKVPPLFRRVDWLALALTFGVVFISYLITLSPELTLEDSGELCTGSFYAGIPHPPGYPVWAIYSWLWTVLLPMGNVAWRVAVGEAFAGAVACGLLALMVSRGSSMLMEGIEELKGMTGKWEQAICLVSGVVAGLLVGYDSIMWSESVAVNRICVYSVPYFLTMLILTLRWIYAPHQYRYLYWALFMYGLSITTHQSLMVASIGLEVLITVRSPKTGRDIFLGNFVIYLIMSMQYWVTGSFIFANIAKGGMFVLFNLVGWGSLVIAVWLAIRTRGILTEWLPVTIMGALCILGVCFYFYEPLSGMTDPPMQWGYPRTVEGFFHALSRGQYEQPSPTNFFVEPGRYFMQLGMLVKQAAEEFTWVNIFIALVPFFFLLRMKKRERCWLIGLSAIYLCVGVLLMDLMNPTPDKASADLIKVFFTSSHTVIAAFIGYGLALVLAYMATHYQQFRRWGLIGGAVAAGLALFVFASETAEAYRGEAGISGVGDLFSWIGQLPHWIGRAFAPQQYGLAVFAGLLLLVLPFIFIVALLVYRDRAPLLITLGLFALMPVHSAMSHWFNSEQRNHWFGYWFGHDMFTPPYNIYPEMARNAVLFGGTDPGRFCPTYMIFCESFIPHKDQPVEDQKFDRRDVYIITQNALADNTYLDYIRAHYNRSTQKDPPFFQELLRTTKEKELNYKTNLVAQIAYQLLDKPFTKLGARVEARRRAEGVYPPKEICTPSTEDSQICFNDYLMDAQRRLDHDMRLEHDMRAPTEAKLLKPGEPTYRLIKPGEDVHLDGNRVSVAGQVAVMAINGLLTKVIFDKNPGNEFYVEESFPLDWMYPYLTPFGVIMKINRQPVAEITDDIVAKDHNFWSKYSERLTGNWITYDTKVEDVARFVETVYLQKDFSGFTNSAGQFVKFSGDRKFIRDKDAGKAFSKLRSSIGGIYDWRINNSKSPAEQQRMIKEADFAFKQAFAFCPYSPEAVYRYVQLLANLRRVDDALLVVNTCLKLDPYNSAMDGLRQSLENAKQANPTAAAPTAPTAPASAPAPSEGVLPPAATASIAAMEKDFTAHPDNFQSGFNLAMNYLQAGEKDNALGVMDKILDSPKLDPSAAVAIAQLANELGDNGRLEKSLQALTRVAASSPEAWYDLTALQAHLNKTNEAVLSLVRMVAANQQRLMQNPNASNLILTARADDRLAPLRKTPQFWALIREHPTNDDDAKRINAQIEQEK